jgi:hypothetical protein
MESKILHYPKDIKINYPYLGVLKGEEDIIMLIYGRNKGIIVHGKEVGKNFDNINLFYYEYFNGVVELRN